MPTFDELSTRQKLVVTDQTKRLLVLAGPGTGKTEVLTHKVVYLVSKRGVAPGEVTALTFSKKAAKEMKDRLGRFSMGELEAVRVSTLHAEALRILQAKNASPRFILSDDESIVLLQDAAYDTRALATGKQIKACHNWIRLKKSVGKLASDLSSLSGMEALFGKVYSRYEEILTYNQAIDLDGLVLETVNCLSKNRINDAPNSGYKYLLIDEYQDINLVEHQLILALSTSAEMLFVVGDDDQSIYGWRGADPKLIRNFQIDFSDGVVRQLQDSMRCTGHIILSGQAIVSKDPGYIPKPLNFVRGEGNPVYILWSSSENKEAYWIANKIAEEIANDSWKAARTALICKRLDLAEPVVDGLKRKGVRTIYWRSKGLFSDDSVLEVIAYLRLLADHGDNLALRYCLECRTGLGVGSVGIGRLRRAAESAKLPIWDILAGTKLPPELVRWEFSFDVFRKRIEDIKLKTMGKKLEDVIQVVARSVETHRLRSIERLKQFSRELPPSSSISDFIDEVHRDRGLDLAGGAPEPEANANAVSIMSMHAAKGLTFDSVFVLGMEEGSFPDLRQDTAEQRRLLYVAMSRARNDLFLCFAKRRIGPPAGGFSFYKPSSFLRDIPSKHYTIVKNT